MVYLVWNRYFFLEETFSNTLYFNNRLAQSSGSRPMKTCHSLTRRYSGNRICIYCMLICLGVAGIAGARQTPMPGYKHRVRAITTEQTPRRARALPSWHERRRTFPSTTELARAKQQNDSFPKFYGFFWVFCSTSRWRLKCVSKWDVCGSS